MKELPRLFASYAYRWLAPGKAKAFSHRGFTLVEIMIVVVIIGLLATMAVPGFQMVRQNAQNNRFIHDIGVIRNTFDQYSLEQGQWPPDAGPATAPTGIEDYMPATIWSADTSIGGNWEWDNGVLGFTAAISCVNYTASNSQLVRIDSKFDDGDLGTGKFQKVSISKVAWILEQ